MLILHALKGAGLPGDMSLCDRMVKAGMANFVGNQWNEAWEWNTVYLDSLDVPELQELYGAIRENLEGDSSKLNGIIILKGATPCLSIMN